MFIREIIKKNPGYDKPFVYHRLMESLRTPHGPRQRLLLNLGKLDLPREDWKTLANRIEEILTGQTCFVSPPDHIESLAQEYAGLLRDREMRSAPVAEKPYWETVDLGSLSQGKARTIGGEAIGCEFFQRLEFPRILREVSFSEEQINKAALLIIGRLLHPASERETALWGTKVSGLGELLGSDFEHLSPNALYRVSDLLVAHQEEIERQLTERERCLYDLGEKIILYDLTNAYLSGTGRRSTKAKRGHSKEKRDDCPLLTLALMIDEDGFPKWSRVLAGNISEPKTVAEFLKGLKGRQLSLSEPAATVVIDAGIATEETLEAIRGEGFHYICVSRVRPKEIPQEGLTIIRQEKDSTVEVKRLHHNGEVVLYCHSRGRQQKEEAIKSRMQERFEEGMRGIEASLERKGGVKKYVKVVERVGRLRQKYPSIARFYEVEVEQEGDKARSIRWRIDEEEKLKVRFSGSYYLRSDRSDLSDEELWSLYIMLTELEEAFRCLKSELGLRPMYHRKDGRLEGHMFIAVLGYHILIAIQRELRQKGIGHRWKTIRRQMATQVRVTASLSNDKGERIHIRQTTEPEAFHEQIYKALGMSSLPLKTKRLRK
jgi:transposase